MPHSIVFESGITFAIAPHAPIGVVIMAHSHKLSRVYRWDLLTDTLTPGQFLKARAFVLDISTDGKYYSYFAETARFRGDFVYACVAKPPYFTALAYFPQGQSVSFNHQRTLCVPQDGPSKWKTPKKRDGREFILDHCPFRIQRHQEFVAPVALDRANDPHRHREVWVEGRKLLAQGANDQEPTVIAFFPSVEPFISIETPDWAKVW